MAVVVVVVVVMVVQKQSEFTNLLPRVGYPSGRDSALDYISEFFLKHLLRVQWTNSFHTNTLTDADTQPRA